MIFYKLRSYSDEIILLKDLIIDKKIKLLILGNIIIEVDCFDSVFQINTLV